MACISNFLSSGSENDERNNVHFTLTHFSRGSASNKRQRPLDRTIANIVV